MLATFHRYAAPFALVLILWAIPCAKAAPPSPDTARSLSVAQAVCCPAVTLKHWQESSSEEKNSFLLGFVTMLELEKEWQGDTPLPIGKSLNSSWVTGLSGVTVRDMAKAVDDAVLANPNKLDMQVVEVLGYTFVRPKLTDRQYREAHERQKQLKNAHTHK